MSDAAGDVPGLHGQERIKTNFHAAKRLRTLSDYMRDYIHSLKQGCL